MTLKNQSKNDQRRDAQDSEHFRGKPRLKPVDKREERRLLNKIRHRQVDVLGADEEEEGEFFS